MRRPNIVGGVMSSSRAGHWTLRSYLMIKLTEQGKSCDQARLIINRGAINRRLVAPLSDVREWSQWEDLHKGKK